MKTRTLVLTLALCFVGAAMCFAADADNDGHLETKRGQIEDRSWGAQE